LARPELVDKGLWELVKPLLQDHTPQRTGRPRVSDRAAFTAIVFVLVTRVPWRMVPRQIGCSGVTVWRRGVKPVIAHRGTEHSSGLGRWHLVAERTIAWLHNYRRLRIRWERDPAVHMGFLTLACALICRRYLMGC
jgi:transposase